jgi:hypothetical protein
MQNMARAMWEHARGMPADSFKTLFDRVYNGTTDVTALWQLGGATNDFLRVHPGALTIPVELATTLLGARNKDARVIGLKLLNRCRVRDEMMVNEIIRALQRRDGYESTGGMCELRRLLERHQLDGSAIDGCLAARLSDELASLLNDDDETERHMAEALVEWLGDLDGQRTAEPSDEPKRKRRLGS